MVQSTALVLGWPERRLTDGRKVEEQLGKRLVSKS